MNKHNENPYAPPTSPLGKEGHTISKRNNPFVEVALGSLFGAVGGSALLICLSMAMVKSAVFGIILVLFSSAFFLIMWIKWIKWSNKTILFDLSFMVIISIFQVLIILTLLFRISPSYERFSHPHDSHSTVQ